jgi:hypothetical protein
MITELGYGGFVDFVTNDSLSYLAGCRSRFDLIFLDGDHSARTVYQEIPASLKLLNRDGVIFLHDYFPDLKPLWSDVAVIPGPFLATDRLRKEGAKLDILPLRRLPWPTKVQSHATSLAVVLRGEESVT